MCVILYVVCITVSLSLAFICMCLFVSSHVPMFHCMYHLCHHFCVCVVASLRATVSLHVLLFHSVCHCGFPLKNVCFFPSHWFVWPVFHWTTWPEFLLPAAAAVHFRMLICFLCYSGTSWWQTSNILWKATTDFLGQCEYCVGCDEQNTAPDL